MPPQRRLFSTPLRDRNALCIFGATVRHKHPPVHSLVTPHLLIPLETFMHDSNLFPFKSRLPTSLSKRRPRSRPRTTPSKTIPTAMKRPMKSRDRFSVDVTSPLRPDRDRRRPLLLFLPIVSLRPHRPCVPRDRRHTQRLSPKGAPTAGILESRQVSLTLPAAGVPATVAFASAFTNVCVTKMYLSLELETEIFFRRNN